MWCCKYTEKRKKDAVPGSRSEERAGASSGPATVRVPGGDAVPAEERKQIIWLPEPWEGSQFYFGPCKCTVCSCCLKSVSGSKQQLNTAADNNLFNMAHGKSHWWGNALQFYSYWLRMFMLAQKNSHRWHDFNNDANWNTCTGNVANSPLSEKLEGSKEESVIHVWIFHWCYKFNSYSE